jgi:hypothetical protein
MQVWRNLGGYTGFVVVQHVPWDGHIVLKLEQEFAPIIDEILSKVKEVKKFPLFAGPRLSRVISHGSIALIGDASHREYSLGQ